METEKKTSLIRNILWAILLVIALARGISTGHWKAFIFLAILFVISKGTLLIGQYKLRKATKHLEESLAARGLPEYIPEPSIIDAMQKKTAAIIERSIACTLQSNACGLPLITTESHPSLKANLAVCLTGIIPNHIPPMLMGSLWQW
jgi:hypothetical protein